MPDSIQLEVATPERQIVREEVESVEAPGKGGYLGILPGHAPLLGQLGTGLLSYGTGGRRRYLSVSGGFLEVLPDHVRVLADVAERAEDVDIERAKRALKTAEEALSKAATTEESTEAAAAVERATARIAVSEKK